MAKKCDGKMTKRKCKGCQFTTACLGQNCTAKKIRGRTKLELLMANPVPDVFDQQQFCVN